MYIYTHNYMYIYTYTTRYIMVYIYIYICISDGETSALRNLKPTVLPLVHPSRQKMKRDFLAIFRAIFTQMRTLELIEIPRRGL